MQVLDQGVGTEADFQRK